PSTTSTLSLHDALPIYPVSGFNDIQIMFDGNHRIAFFHQPIEHHQKFADVFEVQPCNGLIQDIHRFTGGTTLQLGSQFHPLGLSDRKSTRLNSSHVSIS